MAEVGLTASGRPKKNIFGLRKKRRSEAPETKSLDPKNCKKGFKKILLNGFATALLHPLKRLKSRQKLLHFYAFDDFFFLSWVELTCIAWESHGKDLFSL